MQKKIKKQLKWMLAAFPLVVLITLIVFSPYGSSPDFSYKLLRHTVDIHAPVDTVFRFLGNSNNAHRWSVFVDHIRPTNTDSFPDGSVGGRRRCFCKADETGTQWDELITEVVPNKKRQLSTYHLQDFPLTAEGLATEQIYEATGPASCRLSFTLFFKTDKPKIWDVLKTYIGAYRVHTIYKQNMANIKRIVEEEYRRVNRTL